MFILYLKVPAGSDNCVCENGWVGTECDVECSFHGEIINGSCICHESWWGQVCDIPGCPGIVYPV